MMLQNVYTFRSTFSFTVHIGDCPFLITFHHMREIYFLKELVETKNRAKRESVLDLHSPGDQKHNFK